MDEELYRLVSTALLGLIVVLLIVAIARFGRVPRDRPVDTPQPTPPPDSEHDASREAPPVEEAPTEDTEEGPFERDGRWWYRRDGELLVYDELVEQWVDPDAVHAPGSESGTPSAAAATPEHPLDEAKGWDATPSTFAPIPEPASPPEPITEAAAEPDRDEPGGHWKCPACGVINGSTASTCRMCFAARP